MWKAAVWIYLDHWTPDERVDRLRPCVCSGGFPPTYLHCLSFMAGIKGYRRHTTGAGVGRGGSTPGYFTLHEPGKAEAVWAKCMWVAPVQLYAREDNI